MMNGLLAAMCLGAAAGALLALALIWYSGRLDGDE